MAAGQRREVEAAALKMEWVQVLSGSGGLGGSAAAAVDAADEKEGVRRN